MKIDTDLRLAIKSAEKAQQRTHDYAEREKAARASIATFLKTHPDAKRRVMNLKRIIERAEKASSEAGNAMCAQFGLRLMGDQIAFAGCDSEHKHFVKAGGKFAKARENWSFDAVMKELAAASPKEGDAILKRIGIDWA